MGTGRFSGNSYTFSALDMTNASHEEFWFRCSCRTLNQRLTYYFLRDYRRGQEPIACMHLLWESQRKPGSRFPLSMGSWEAVVQSCSTYRWTSHDRGELPGENGDKRERSQCITQRAEQWVLPLTDPAETIRLLDDGSA